jgi:hypothetical protein
MYHTIEFLEGVTVDLTVSNRDRLERLLIVPGTCLNVQIRPYVVESAAGPVEVADLFLDDGTAIYHVPFGFFRFKD